MLSNNTSNLPPGQHRRQSSTPTVFDTLKVPILPATKLQHGSHRRGLSLDQPINSFHLRPTVFQQDDTEVSIKDYQQHYLRDTQQQQQLARPGQKLQPKQTLHNEGSLRDLQSKSHPEYDSGTPAHIRSIDQKPLLNISNESNSHDLCKTENMNNSKYLDSTKFAGYLEGFEFEALSKALNVELRESTIAQDKLNIKSADMFLPRAGWQGPQRPCTPTTQLDKCFFPTSTDAPFFSNAKKPSQSAGTRTVESSPTRRDPNSTIKASHAMKRGSSFQDVFNMSGGSSKTREAPSPPRPRSQISSGLVDMAAFPPLEFLNMSTMHMDFSSNDVAYSSSHCSPLSNALSSPVSSFQSSPEITHLSLFHDSKNGVPGPLESGQFFSLPAPQNDLDPSDHPSKECSQSRSQSVSELDLDASMEDTGITPEEIAAFMYGPRSSDGRWVCTFPGCTRDFGRKENIKSHVQTHLGDRQFICKTCGNDFVRQHDLKRHAKIHSGVKPYTCPCGRNFARHDALTRHRQRNTCEGGFEGMSKTPTKRGRPKKLRPDADKRLEKAAKTRQRALEKASTSSISGSSECSFPSPSHISDDMDAGGRSPFDVESLTADLTEFLSKTPPASPGYASGTCVSPQNSRHSYTPKGVSMSPSPKIMSIPEEPRDMLPSHALSRKSSISYYSTPPELDLSSSSPVVSSFVDFDLGSKAVADAPPTMDVSESKDSSRDFDPVRSRRDDEKLFLESLDACHPISGLDKDSAFLTGNFEDHFCSGSAWQHDGFDLAAEDFFNIL